MVRLFVAVVVFDVGRFWRRVALRLIVMAIQLFSCSAVSGIRFTRTAPLCCLGLIADNYQVSKVVTIIIVK